MSNRRDFFKKSSLLGLSVLASKFASAEKIDALEKLAGPEFIPFILPQLPYAYDDFGKPNSIFFASLLDKADYLKLDIYFLQTIKVQPSYIEILKGMVKFAKANNKYTILEGVETEQDLQIAKDIGVDYIQGYLFKSEFISIWN